MSGQRDSSGRTDPAGVHWLSALESEAIEIIREGAATAARPVMLYSMGKDSSVLLHLARKAFWPARPPLRLLHIDTTWQFREMIAFRDRMAAEAGVELLVHVNREGLKAGADPFADGSERYTGVMITEALRQALDAGNYDIIFVGGRRDEEKSRAKERVFSFRKRSPSVGPQGAAPRALGPVQHACPGGRIAPRVSALQLDGGPTSGATSRPRRFPVVPLYFAKKRPVVEREGQWIMVDDERMPLESGEEPRWLRVRFRTLGCYPLTAAVESDADHAGGDPRRDPDDPLLRTPGTAGGPRRGRLHGTQEEGRLLLSQYSKV